MALYGPVGDRKCFGGVSSEIRSIRSKNEGGKEWEFG